MGIDLIKSVADGKLHLNFSITKMSMENEQVFENLHLKLKYHNKQEGTIHFSGIEFYQKYSLNASEFSI